MPHYLIELFYKPPDVAAAFDDPAEALRPAAESLGGSVENGWLSVGDYNLVGVVDLPQRMAEQAVSAALTTFEGVKAVRTSLLFDRDEGILMARCIHGYPSVTGECEHAV